MDHIPQWPHVLHVGGGALLLNVSNESLHLREIFLPFTNGVLVAVGSGSGRGSGRERKTGQFAESFDFTRCR